MSLTQLLIWQQLLLDGRPMIDPMSLNDYPSILGSTRAEVTVVEVVPAPDDD